MIDPSFFNYLSAMGTKHINQKGLINPNLYNNTYELVEKLYLDNKMSIYKKLQI